MDVLKILKKSGPMLSSDIVSAMAKRDKITKDAARKRISRISTGEIFRLGLGLPKREAFLYLPEQYKKPDFIVNLINAFKSTRSAFGQALLGLEARNGLVYHNTFPIVSGLPTTNTKKHLLHSKVEKDLLELGILEIEDHLGSQFIGIRGLVDSFDHHHAVSVVESIVLTSIKSWLGKSGMASFYATKIRTEKIPHFGPFAWDLTGPCYLNGIAERKKDGRVLNGFIVGDILLYKQVHPNDIIPFMAKISTINGQKSHRRFIPIFIGDSFTADALHILRKHGVLLAVPEQIFGRAVANQLKMLIRTIENAAAAVTKNPDDVFNLLGKVIKIEGAASNLRGVVMELIVARLFSFYGYNISIRQKIRTRDGKVAEIDVKAVRKDEVVFIECKAPLPTNLVTEDEVIHWENSTVPRIKSWLKRVESLPENRKFIFWSATRYDEKACLKIKEIQEAYLKRPLYFKDGDELISDLREAKENSLINIFKETFKE